MNLILWHQINNDSVHVFAPFALNITILDVGRYGLVLLLGVVVGNFWLLDISFMTTL